MQEKLTITRNGRTLNIEKDHYIYEVYYKGHNIGYFILERLQDAINKITNTGFYDGRNYDYRMNEIDGVK
jgi:hypothetical protein